MRATERFTGRVENYVKYRPEYPGELLSHLTAQGILTRRSIVADVGSGTGLLTKLFLENGNPVLGIEPNRAMRLAGEKLLAGFSNFTSVDGAAEATGLARGSVDLVVAGQAFHWFDREQAAVEFSRILRNPGWIVLVWNERRTDTTKFLIGYERLLSTYSIDYGLVDHRNMTEEVIAAFFKPSEVLLQTYSNQQAVDLESLRGRLLSSSYVPGPENSRYEEMLAALHALFDACQSNGQVVIEYTTKVYIGRKRPS